MLMNISLGNIPSRWAHTMQIMKMAEALSQQVDDFGLLVQCHPDNRYGLEQRLFEHYGILEPFDIHVSNDEALPTDPIFEGYHYPEFQESAATYASVMPVKFVFTRACQAAVATIEDGIPTIVETHVTPDHPDLKCLLPVANRSAFRGLVTISNILKKYYVEAGIPESNILVWPDAVNLESFDSIASQAAAREMLELKPAQPLAVYCGHLYANRGIEEILAAAEQVPEVDFLIVGGWPKDVAQRQAEAKHLDNVRFTGFVNNGLVPYYLKASDLLLMPFSRDCPSAAYMSPMKLFEYMAAARPIVATDLEAIRLHLDHERNAWLCQPDDGAALAQAIRKLISLPNLAEHCAQQARLDVAEFTWQNRARAIVERFGIDC